MPTRHILSINLRREIERQRKSVGDIAMKASVPAVEVYQALAGELGPTVDWLERVASTLGLEVCDLIRPQ